MLEEQIDSEEEFSESEEFVGDCIIHKSQTVNHKHSFS